MSRIVKRPRLSSGDSNRENEEETTATTPINSDAAIMEKEKEHPDFEYKKLSPLGNGHFVFTPVRSKRFLENGWRSDVFQQEDIRIRMNYIFNPNGAISEEAMVKLHEDVRKQAEELIKDIEILAMASKTVPEWLGNDREYIRCTEKFSSKK